MGLVSLEQPILIRLDKSAAVTALCFSLACVSGKALLRCLNRFRSFK
jgi:hypothetical protein